MGDGAWTVEEVWGQRSTKGQGSWEGLGLSEGAGRCKCVHREGTEHWSPLAPCWLHRTWLLLGLALSQCMPDFTHSVEGGIWVDFCALSR